MCRAVYTEDNQEYEAKITEIKKDAENNTYFTIVFVEYGNEQAVWGDDLKKSEKANQETTATPTETTATPTETTDSAATVDAVDNKAEVKEEKVSKVCKNI